MRIPWWYGVAVGDAWWLYLLSGLIQGVAFWYLVRRATKTARYRRQAGMESDAGADPAGEE